MMSEQQILQAAQMLGLSIVQDYAKDGDELVINTNIMYEDIVIHSYKIRQDYNTILSQLNARLDSVTNTKSITEQQIAEISALAEE